MGSERARYLLKGTQQGRSRAALKASLLTQPRAPSGTTLRSHLQNGQVRLQVTCQHSPS